jgi:hypothetical protein
MFNIEEEIKEEFKELPRKKSLIDDELRFTKAINKTI